VLNRENLRLSAINGHRTLWGWEKNAEGCPRESLVPRLRIIASTVRRYIRRHGVNLYSATPYIRREDLERLMYMIAAEAFKKRYLRS